jgi:hypothetical protein
MKKLSVLKMFIFEGQARINKTGKFVTSDDKFGFKPNRGRADMGLKKIQIH